MKVSIVDPHGHHLGDSLGKLRGLAAFAVEYGEAFHRVEAVAKTEDGTLKVLDLKEPSVRKALATAIDAKTLYASAVAGGYLP